MAVTLILVGKTPGQTQFGLDQFTEHYKTDTTADEVLTDATVPQRGDVHPDYSFMFVTDRHCQETSERASALDLVYTGCLTSSGGLPVLPPQQHESITQVQSASSIRSSNGKILTSPITVQFYAPSKVLNYVSYLVEGTDIAADPTGDIVIITITSGDTTFTGSSTPELIAGFFSEQIIETPNASEVVAGKFWANTSRKVKNLIPFAFTLLPGPLLSIFAPGTAYAIGNTLTISSGGESASISVTGLGVSNSITTFTTSSNTFTVAHTGLAATGGSGSGAQFNVLIVP